MAEVTRQKKLQTVSCKQCGHKTYKNIVRKGAGG
jgi:ribosomal protein L37E